MDASDKLRDHVQLLQIMFMDQLNAMKDVLGNIQRFAGQEHLNLGELYNYDNIPNDAKEIVRKTLVIDKLIDEALEETYLGLPINEIIEKLQQESDDYLVKLSELDDYKKRGEERIAKINEMMNLLTLNTSWYNDNVDEEEDFNDSS